MLIDVNLSQQLTQTLFAAHSGNTALPARQALLLARELFAAKVKRLLIDLSR